MTYISSDKLDITEPTPRDDGIMRYEYYAYNPKTGDNLNSQGDITIVINNKDIITHPCESYLLIEGRLAKADAAAYGADDKVTLINNALMYLFSNITLKLSDKDIESLNYPGHATTLLGLLKYPRRLPQGLNQLWCIDSDDTLTAENYGYRKRQNYIIKKPGVKGTFSFIVPLKHIFGFCEDYDKAMYGFSYTLKFTRQNDNNAIIHGDGVAPGKVALTKLEWMMPHVNLSLAEESKFFKVIQAKEDIPVSFMQRVCETTEVVNTKNFTWTFSSQSSPNFPRYIIVGFQTDRLGNQTANPAVFDHCNVKSIKAVINSKDYPGVAYDLSFADNMYSRAYRDAATFSAKFMGMNELITNSSIDTDEYKNLYPLFVLDVSKQEEMHKLTTVDIKIKAEFSENVPANTQAYALIISDKIGTFKSNGSELRFVE